MVLGLGAIYDLNLPMRSRWYADPEHYAAVCVLGYGAKTGAGTRKNAVILVSFNFWKIQSKAKNLQVLTLVASEWNGPAKGGPIRDHLFWFTKCYSYTGVQTDSKCLFAINGGAVEGLGWALRQKVIAGALPAKQSPQGSARARRRLHAPQSS